MPGKTELQSEHRPITWSSAGQKKSTNEADKFNHDRAIFDDSLTLGKNLYEITGQLPSADNFASLFSNHVCEYEPSEIVRIFGDWETFAEDIRIEYELEREQKQKKREQLLEIIELDAKVGALHPALLRENLPSKSFEQLAAEDNGGRSRWNIRLILDLEVADDEKIRRYVLFKIAEQLTRNLEAEGSEMEQMDLLVRRTNITLGFNVETGLACSGFKSEIAKTNSALNPAEIEYAIEDIAIENGWLDYLHPKQRQRDLEKLKKLASIRAPRNAGQEVMPETSDELLYDLKKKKLLGSIALKRYMQTSSRPDHIRPLGELLTDLSYIPGPRRRHNNYEYKDWDRERYLEYGRFLLQALEPYDAVISERLLVKAYRMRLGPSWAEIANGKNFASLKEYYRDLGMQPKKRGRFAHWSMEDYIDWAKAVAAANDGVISTEILRVWGQQHPDQPTLKIIKRSVPGGVTGLIEAAQLPLNRNRYTFEDCIASGLAYYKLTGALPDRDAIKNSDLLPSPEAIYHHCGSIPAFRHEIVEAAREENELQKLAA